MYFLALKTIEKYKMLKDCKNVVCGVSGGADSTALLIFMCSLREKYDINVYAVHINHGIRGEEAKRDCDFVKNLCKKLNVEITVKEYDIPNMAREKGITEEEAGRLIRYEEFENERKKHEKCKIAVAHNMNDQTETIIMRLCRGTGLKGLCGIRPVRGNIIRPMIFCSRDDIEKYLSELGQDFCTDSTNLKDDYTRNKIRLNIVPLMKDINNSVIENISRTTEILNEDEEYIERMAQAAFERVVEGEKEGAIVLNCEKFKKEDRVIKKRIAQKALLHIKKDIKDISKWHIEEILNFSEKENAHFDLPNLISVDFKYNKITFSVKEEISSKEIQKSDFFYNVEEDKPVFVKECGIWVEFSKTEKKSCYNLNNLCTKAFDYGKINKGLCIRNKKVHDIITINKNGNSKKLKKLFIDMKLPADIRENIPLLAIGDDIVWAIGVRTGSYYTVHDETVEKCYIHTWRN